MAAPPPTPVAQHAWRREGQRAVRLAALAVRGACSEAEGAGEVGYTALSQLLNTGLALAHLPSRPLFALSALPGLRAACAAKLCNDALAAGGAVVGAVEAGAAAAAAAVGALAPLRPSAGVVGAAGVQGSRGGGGRGDCGGEPTGGESGDAGLQGVGMGSGAVAAAEVESVVTEGWHARDKGALGDVMTVPQAGRLITVAATSLVRDSATKAAAALAAVRQVAAQAGACMVSCGVDEGLRGVVGGEMGDLAARVVRAWERVAGMEGALPALSPPHPLGGLPLAPEAVKGPQGQAIVGGAAAPSGGGGGGEGKGGGKASAPDPVRLPPPVQPTQPPHPLPVAELEARATVWLCVWMSAPYVQEGEGEEGLAAVAEALAAAG